MGAFRAVLYNFKEPTFPIPIARVAAVASKFTEIYIFPAFFIAFLDKFYVSYVTPFLE